MTDKKINPKTIMGAKKEQIHLVPPDFIRGTSRAMYYGAHLAAKNDGSKGYGEFNWRDATTSYLTLLNASMRHHLLLLEGEDIDKDSGLPHEDHIAANMCIIKDAKNNQCLDDDRHKDLKYKKQQLEQSLEKVYQYNKGCHNPMTPLDDSKCLTMEEHMKRVNDSNDPYGKRYIKR